MRSAHVSPARSEQGNKRFEIRYFGPPSSVAGTREEYLFQGVNMSNLRVFVSSKQSEFQLERAVIKHEIESIPRLEADLAEDWAPERNNVRSVFFDRVTSAHFYVGLFGCTYSEPTCAEYLEARKNSYREILIYVKACAD